MKYVWLKRQHNVELTGKRLKSACLWGEREIVMTHKEHPQSTDNVLIDLGFDDAEELSAKTLLAVKLNDLVDKWSLSQTEAARLTGMTLVGRI